MQKLGTFGLLALILAAIGTYGVMSYSVSQRAQEIGIRMSLGAPARDVRQLILASGLAMVSTGVAVGLVLSTLLARGMNSLLFGIGSFDGPSFLGTPDSCGDGSVLDFGAARHARRSPDCPSLRLTSSPPWKANNYRERCMLDHRPQQLAGHKLSRGFILSAGEGP